ncbi:MAG: immune inhibitor A [Chloroflexi bacterium]|nr:immune inhibitor A [Chloroflexota bacterium]
MTENKSGTKAVVIGITVALCCICLLTAGLGGYGYYMFNQNSPVAGSPITLSGGESPTSVPEIARPSAESITNETLNILEQSLVPENNPYELSCRLDGLCNIPTTVEGKTYQLGDIEKFWVLNSDTQEHRQAEAELLYITEHSYFWAESGVSVNEDDMKALMDTFENEIYPTDREFFGSEWTPGVDGDPRIFVLYANDIGSKIAGYFNPSDEYNPLVKEYSNAHETYVLGSNQGLARDYTYSTLAHEFVHMIQFSSDRNESSWMSEGFANVGAFINGYGFGNSDYVFIQNTDLQLNDWAPNTSPDFGAHYGESSLFLTYFLDRFGESATKALTSNPKNDLTSVDDTLAALNISDPVTGKLINADDFFMDWAVTNFLLDGSVGDGRYIYKNYPDAPRASALESISNCPQAPLAYNVHQYGVDYISIECAGDYTLSFTGSTVIGLLPADPHSGQYAFWSNKGDESDMTLTKEFDFTDVSAPINFTFHTWYHIEENWDYLYLEVSEDGENWQIIKTPSGTDADPSGGAYGWGYTGASNGWIEETIDLSEYAGKKIAVRFEYITDAAVHEDGFLLDDIVVEAAGYRSDFEADDGGWAAEGFARIQNTLPQTFGLALIKTSDSSVTMIQLNEDQTANIPLSLKSGEKAFLVISGLTRFTRELASYQIEIK